MLLGECPLGAWGKKKKKMLESLCPARLYKSSVKSQDYQGILERNGLANVRKLCLSSRSWVLRRDKTQPGAANND